MRRICVFIRMVEIQEAVRDTKFADGKCADFFALSNDVLYALVCLAKN